jgi:hypothetical protein
MAWDGGADPLRGRFQIVDLGLQVGNPFLAPGQFLGQLRPALPQTLKQGDLCGVSLFVILAPWTRKMIFRRSARRQ